MSQRTSNHSIHPTIKGRVISGVSLIKIYFIKNSILIFACIFVLGACQNSTSINKIENLCIDNVQSQSVAHPLLCGENYLFPEGSEMLLFDNNKFVHVVFSNGIRRPNKIDAKITIEGEARKTHVKFASSPIRTEIKEYEFFYVEKWYYQNKDNK